MHVTNRIQSPKVAFATKRTQFPNFYLLLREHNSPTFICYQESTNPQVVFAIKRAQFPKLYLLLREHNSLSGFCY